jgi:hypothetical protein
MGDVPAAHVHEPGTGPPHPCSDAACDGAPFVGPDGTTASYFSTDGTHEIAALGLTGRYAQYRMRFSTAMPSVSPALLRVAATARRQ